MRWVNQKYITALIVRLGEINVLDFVDRLTIHQMIRQASVGKKLLCVHMSQTTQRH